MDELYSLGLNEYSGFIKGMKYFQKNILYLNEESVENIIEKLKINYKLEITSLEMSIEGNQYINETLELKKLNEVLEREVNLLKSLILINNLNLSNPDLLCNKNYFINMCDDDNVKEIINNERLFNKQDTLHTLIIKINVFYIFIIEF